ncbi:MAG: endonuclease/exonuclease/phosphatase family protein [Chitinophagaceae bacterium]
MIGRSKKLFRKFLIICNIAIVVVYLLSCLAPSLHAGKFWFIALLGLGFHALFILVLAALICMAIMRSKWVFLPLASLVLSWQQVSVAFGIHTKTFTNTKQEGTLRVLSWNVSFWDEGNRDSNGGWSFRDSMMKLVQTQNADILCFQEFFESRDAKYYAMNIPALEEMGFAYHYFFPTLSRHGGKFQNGVVILSKFPMVDSAQFIYDENSAAERLISADIKVGDQTFRVLTTHLQSVMFNTQDYQGLNEIKHTGNKAIDATKNIVAKLRKGYNFRSGQAEMVRRYINESPFPVIVCGDFNDVPNSYAYFTVKGDLQDAFLKAGYGLSRTFRFISPTLRIDYIFADKTFKVNQYARLKVPYSDHYPIVADLSYERTADSRLTGR